MFAESVPSVRMHRPAGPIWRGGGVTDTRYRPGPDGGGAARETRVFTPRRASARITYPFTTRGGRRLSVTLAVEPIINLALDSAVAGQLAEEIRLSDCGRLLEPAERLGLDPADLERLDCELFQRGLPLLTESGLPTGVAPVSYRTLARAHGRFSLLGSSMQAPSQSRFPVIAEIIDVEADISHERLQEIIGLIAAWRSGVIVRPVRDMRAVDLLSGLPSRGVSLDAGANRGMAPAAWASLEGLVRVARTFTPFMMVHRLNPSWAARARDAGATHATFTAFEGVKA